MLDVARIEGTDKVVGLLEELQDGHPELGVVPYRTIPGTSYPVALRVGRPTAGFRKANAGVVPSKSTFAQKIVECYILSARIEIDKAIAWAHPDGPGTLEAIETIGAASAAFAAVGYQFYYGPTAGVTMGLSGVTAGHPGLIDYVDPTMVVDAGGTTAATAASVYLCRLGIGDVSFVGGMGMTINLTPFRDESIQDASLNKLPGRVSDLMAWLGVQNLSTYNVARIKKVTADAGKGLTDTLIATAFSKFPIGKKPTHIFMSRRSQLQLQVSRSVTIFSGMGQKAQANMENIVPLPTESMGMPIVVTDSILEVEPLTL